MDKGGGKPNFNPCAAPLVPSRAPFRLIGGIDLIDGRCFEPFPGPFTGSGVAGCNRQRRLGTGHAFGQRYRPTDDHEKIVGMRPFVGHDELEMDPKEFPAKHVVVLGLDDFPEPDRHDGGVASGGANIDAVAGDRVERKEIPSRPCATGSRSSRSKARSPAGGGDRGNPLKRHGNRRSGNCRRS